MGHESRIELWSPLDHRTACWFRNEQPMKTAGRENPNRWATVSSTRVHGAEVQNRSRSIQGAGKQEKLRPREMCFFLTSPFIELLRTYAEEASIPINYKVESLVPCLF